MFVATGGTVPVSDEVTQGPEALREPRGALWLLAEVEAHWKNNSAGEGNEDGDGEADGDGEGGEEGGEGGDAVAAQGIDPTINMPPLHVMAVPITASEGQDDTSELQKFFDGLPDEDERAMSNDAD